MNLPDLFKKLTAFKKNLSVDIRDRSQWPSEWTKILIKRYDRFPQVLLPETLLEAKKGFWEILETRHSHREPRPLQITLPQLSTLLYYSAGLKGGVRAYTPDTPSKIFDQSRRFYPSGGARYPLEVYVGIRNHPELDTALYHYNVMNHSLEKLFTEHEFTLTMQSLEKEFGWIVDCDTFIFTGAVFARSSVKYDTFAYNLALTEAGHLMQNVVLAATALNIQSCILSVLGDTMHTVYDLDDNEVILDMIPLSK